jgi:hypothetical protein
MTRPREKADTAALLEELIQGCAEHGTAIDGMTDEEAIAHMRRVRERLWEAKHAYRPRHEGSHPSSGACHAHLEIGTMNGTPSRRPTPAQRARAGRNLQKLFELAAKEGTAIDGMTDEEAIAHMRRVREGLWNAKHAYHPGRK